jgi:hypothetical protein
LIEIDELWRDFLVQATTTTKTQSTVTTKPWTTPLYLNISNSSLVSRSFFRFRWEFNDSFDSSLLSSSKEPTSRRSPFLTFILYILGALLALTLLIILLAIIIFTYRKHCLPSSTLSVPIIAYRYHSNKKKKHNHHIDQDTRTEKTMITTVRSYYSRQ